MSVAAPDLDLAPESGSSERLRLRSVEAPPAAEPMFLDVHQVSVATVARTVACLMALAAAALVGTGLTLWWLAGRAGLLGAAEDAIASSLGLESWTMPAAVLLGGWVGAVAVLALAAVVVTVLLAVAFNRIGRSLGGVKVVATPGQPDPTS
jgi:hypothetical protein